MTRTFLKELQKREVRNKLTSSCRVGLPRWLSGKHSSCNVGALGDVDSILDLKKDPLEEGMTIHSNIHALLENRRTEKPGAGEGWGATVHKVAKTWTPLK